MDSENGRKNPLPAIVPLAVLQLAHDLRHDLAGIDRRIEALRARLPQDHELERDFAQMNAAIDNGFDAARELIAFARRSGDTGRVDVNGLVHQARGIIERMLGPRVRVYLDLSPARPVARMDVASLEWMLLSLVLLGRKATAGRGAVTVGTQTVDETSRELPGQPAGGNWALLTVSDTGLGMHQGVAGPIEETFAPSDAETDITFDDVRRLVRKLGGSLHAQEIKPYGTHVHVFLPLIRPVGRPE